MSPNLKTSVGGGLIGENGNERTGVETSGGIRAGKRREMDDRGSRRADGFELSPGQAVVEALCEPRRRWVGTWERGASLQSSEAEEDAQEGRAPDPREIFRRGRHKVWTNAGGRAFGQRRPDRVIGEYGEAVDVVGGIVEPRQKSAPASAKKGTARAL